MYGEIQILVRGCLSLIIVPRFTEKGSTPKLAWYERDWGIWTTGVARAHRVFSVLRLVPRFSQGIPRNAVSADSPPLVPMTCPIPPCTPTLTYQCGGVPAAATVVVLVTGMDVRVSPGPISNKRIRLVGTLFSSRPVVFRIKNSCDNVYSASVPSARKFNRKSLNSRRDWRGGGASRAGGQNAGGQTGTGMSLESNEGSLGGVSEHTQRGVRLAALRWVL